MKYTLEHLQDMPSSKLDSIIAANILLWKRTSASPTVPAISSTWEGFGALINHMRQIGYTIHMSAFEERHLRDLEKSKCFHDGVRRYSVNFIWVEPRAKHHKRKAGFCNDDRHEAYADDMPRAAAIAAILARQYKRQLKTTKG